MPGTGWPSRLRGRIRGGSRGAASRKKRTSRGPEALGGLDEQVLEETGVAVTEELRADEGEDGEAGVQSVVVVHCHRSSINGRHKHPRNVLTVLDGDDLDGRRRDSSRGGHDDDGNMLLDCTMCERELLGNPGRCTYC